MDSKRTDRNDGETFNSLSRRTLLLASGTALAAPIGSALSGVATAASDRIDGETGSIRANQPDRGTWRTVSLDGSYADPVVIAKPPSSEGGQPTHVRLRDVSADSFAFQLEEWAYLDGSHITERLHYLVVDAGAGTLADRTAIEAGTLPADEDWEASAFEASFSSRPVLFTQAQTYRGSHEIVTRNRNVSKRRFAVRVQEEEGRDGGHATERIGYVAIEPTRTSGFEVGSTSNVVTESWQAIPFDGSYSDPAFVADMQTADGPDTAALRYRRLDSDGVDVRVEEGRSGDTETNHTTERVSYLVTSGGLFDNGVTVLEDFEDRSLSAYTGDVGEFGFETGSPLEGTASLEGTDRDGVIANGGVRTPRGYEYRVRVVPRSDSYQRIVFNAQDVSNPERDCYELFFGGKYGDIALQERQDGTRTSLVKASYSFSPGTGYIAGFTSTEDGVYATLYDAGGSVLVETPVMDSTTHSGGYLGFGVGPVTDVEWDYVTQHADPDPRSGENDFAMLEDFENQSLGGYTGDIGGFGFEMDSPLEGTTSLEGQSAGGVITTDRIETPRGYQYRARIGPTEGSYQRIVFNAQDTQDPEADCYELFIGPKHGDLFVQERRGGEWTERAGASFDADPGSVYEVVFIATDATIEALIYDAAGNRLVRTGAIESSIHTGGYLGFGVGSVAGVRWDAVRRGSIPASYDPPAVNAIDGSGVTTPTYPGVSGEKVFMSDHGGSLSNALAAASPGDAVVVDGSYEVGVGNDAKSGVDIIGDGSGSDAYSGGTLRYTGSSRDEIIPVEYVSDVHIHGIEIDATVGSESPGRLVGSPSTNQVEEFTVTNCVFVGGRNAINFRGHSKDNYFRDISIVGNTCREQHRHGIFLGIDAISGRSNDYPTGELTNVLVSDNLVTDTITWIGITLSGRPNAPCYGTRIADNTVRRMSLDAQVDGHAFLYEDYCHDNYLEGNEAYDLNKAGYMVSGQAFRNTVRNNYVENCGRALACEGTHPHSGDPRNNEFIANRGRDISWYCINNPETADPNNLFERNEFADWANRISDPNRDTFVDNTFE